MSNLDPHGLPSTYSTAERRLRAIGFVQPDVLDALKQCSRLATLGESLARISHDLRNMLATGQLMAERLEGSPDPLVAQVLPKLIGSLDRAIRLCETTIRGDAVAEAPPAPEPTDLPALVAEVAADLGLTADTHPVRCAVRMAVAYRVQADPHHLYRVLSNLMRNAAQAIAASGAPGEIVVQATREGGQDLILVQDTGPGLPAVARSHLFQPFVGSARSGGSGLGLAISQELIAAQGGHLSLVATGPEGTTFQIALPAI